MSERLRQLQRQQSLLSEHLAWIDAEIAREAATTDSTPPPAALPPTSTQPLSSQLTPVAASTSPTPAIVPAGDADALMERLASEERQNPDDVRRGCLIIFISVMALIIISVTLIWLVYYR
ncbi:MAG: hypothetical protein WC205_05790 [Opitutaceae bacterium]|jgi:hypothetical protein